MATTSLIYLILIAALVLMWPVANYISRDRTRRKWKKILSIYRCCTYLWLQPIVTAAFLAFSIPLTIVTGSHSALLVTLGFGCVLAGIMICNFVNVWTDASMVVKLEDQLKDSKATKATTNVYTSVDFSTLDPKEVQDA